MKIGNILRKKGIVSYFFLAPLLILLFFFWFRGGFESVGLSYDFGRDLSEISNLWIGQKIIWLGPQLIGNFPASSIYYYLFYPALWLSGGNGNSIIVANLLLATVALGTFGILSIKRWGKSGLIMVSLIGLSPWWQMNALTPGNGSTYVLWLFCALVALYFKSSIAISSLLCGLSIAYHPAAVFILPLLFYEWWIQKHSLKSLLLILFGLLLPSFPTIVFEIITKGFLTRTWLAHPSAGLLIVAKTINFSNILQAGEIAGLGIFIPLFLLIFFMRNMKREKIWYCIALLPLIIFSFFNPLASRYLMGIVCTLWFVWLITLPNNKWGKIILVILFIFFFGKYVVFAQPVVKMQRNIPRMSKIVDNLIKQNGIDKKKRIAVVEAIDKGGSVAAADDYRFFLRMKKYNVLSVQQYNKAELLIMFIEQPNFKWKTWSTWEIEQAGCKKILKIVDIDKLMFQYMCLITENFRF